MDRIKELIASGELGKISTVQINAFEWHEFEPDSPRYLVFRKGESGGGPMMDFGFHRMEVLLNILGPVKKKAGMIHSVLFDREVEDNSAALFHFENGAFGALYVSNSIFEQATSWTSTVVRAPSTYLC